MFRFVRNFFVALGFKTSDQPVFWTLVALSLWLLNFVLTVFDKGCTFSDLFIRDAVYGANILNLIELGWP